MLVEGGTIPIWSCCGMLSHAKNYRVKFRESGELTKDGIMGKGDIRRDVNQVSRSKRDRRY